MILQRNDLFISDIHLDGLHPTRQAVLEQFIELYAARAARLFILGDLFNAWIGRKQLADDYVRRLTQTVARAAAGGLEVHFVAGNRDFYGLQELGRAASMQTHTHGFSIDSFGQKTWVCHGHHLYRADRDTHGAQKVTNWRPIENIFQAVPARLARFLANGYQNYSRRAVRQKTRRMLTVSDEAMLELHQQGHQVIVSGHTHSLGHTVYKHDGQSWDFYNLGSWDTRPHFLRHGPDGWHFHTLERTSAEVGFPFGSI